MLLGNSVGNSILRKFFPPPPRLATGSDVSPSKCARVLTGAEFREQLAEKAVNKRQKEDEKQQRKEDRERKKLEKEDEQQQRKEDRERKKLEKEAERNAKTAKKSI